MTTKITLCDDISEQFDSPAYQLLEKIGEGGFGRVYRAIQVNTGQIVAIKFLSIGAEFDLSKRTRYIERFQRETLLGSRLQHPNIVRLLDKGKSGELLYAVFEFVEGKTLKQTLLESGTLMPSDAAAVMSQVLDALSHAHEQGVIHRDIKPANIILTKTGAKTHAKVLDFGIGTFVNEARLEDHKSITLTQETLGTPSYSSPEQLRGEPPTVKTDLYVWGLVFIECLTGQPAMSGSNLASVFHKQLSQSNVPLPAAIVGHPIAALLRRVLQKKAHERTVNARELYQELTQINFSNLVGDMAAPKEHRSEHSTTVLRSDFDETVIHDSAMQYSSLTERKQITALSINLSVHSVTDQVIDHEVADALHRDQKNQCLDTAVRYGGFHAGTLGDTQLFYFGYPAVSDNDSRLCARTALDMISSLRKRNALLKNSQGIRMEIRAGMHTGLVTCYADAVPEGDTPNIAMQLARMANCCQVLCSDSSRNMLEGYINFEPRQSCMLGIDSTETALYNLSSERHVEAFGFLRGTQNNNVFIGREEELKSLDALLYNPELDNTSSILSPNKFAHVYGEAGIGKSRLIFELRNRCPQMFHYGAQCLPEQVNNALYPILNMLKYKYSLEALTQSGAVNKLINVLNHIQPQSAQETVPVLCSWLGLPLPEGLPVSPLSPELQKQVLFAGLAALLISPDQVKETQPNLFIFEDMHWADPVSIEFVAYLNQDQGFIDSSDVFITTSRLPLPKLLKAADFELIEIGRLCQAKTREFVINLFDNKKVSSHLLDVVVSRTDGIPLFIEELVNMLKQKGLTQHLNGITDFTHAENIDEVPNSLRDSLQQKLDALVSAKETIQLAAVIGREFDYALFASASKRSEAQLQNDLTELLEAELIYLQRKVAGDSYIFKHALVRDAAYDSIPSAALIALHSRVADALKTHPETADMVVAEHLANAQRYAEAIALGLSAAQTALAKSLSQSAFDIANKALNWNELREDSAEKFESSLHLLAVTLPAIMIVSGMGADSVGEEIKRCEIALQGLKDLPSGSLTQAQMELERSSKFALVGFYNVRSMRRKARVTAEELLKQAMFLKDVEFEIAIRSILGQNYYMEGMYLQAKETLETAIAMYEPEKHQGLAVKYSLEPESYCRMTLALALWKLGYADQAVTTAKSAHERATAIGHTASVAMANVYLGLIGYFRKEPDFILEVSENNKKMCERYPDMAWCTLFLKCLEEWSNKSTLHTEPFIAQKRAENELFAMTFYEATLAETKIQLGDIEQALELLSESINWCHKTGETIALPTLYRIRAQGYLASSKYDTDAAVNALKNAVNIAQKQGSIALELDACVDLCMFYKLEQQFSKVVELLGPLLAKFSEGFETTVFQEASLLLADCRENQKKHEYTA
ncbi:TOMM system kinase/cyclase fusion protein [Psychromonas ossibalaenae]|uniref:TOMM system kinase/cyclase fusion protein n=1 Tax=Psychromonas ossibalaenae TaxID=444922 RepID=UPI0003663A9E|nr:TOMM system kinase/cyclase fusion protein [Psychromonas ossibalaenae]